MSMIEVKVPDIGDFKDVPVIEVFVKPGDTVKKEDSLVTLESDKATMDVPSPAAGTVKELKLKVGDKVSEGSVILTLDSAAAGAATAAPAAPAKAAPPAPVRHRCPRQARRPTPARPTSIARWSCSARARAATARLFAPPISA
jgi:pyruvate/2-oxoglutarate dehydrogenase complex dihydrolipoamide acyltransferase (E2) component